MNIGRKIYFDKNTGNFLCDTGERSGSVIPTTTEQDFETYSILQSRIINSVIIIELEFGQYSEYFNGNYNYSLNLQTNEIIFIQREPDPPQTQPPSIEDRITALEDAFLEFMLTNI